MNSSGLQKLACASVCLSVAAFACFEGEPRSAAAQASGCTSDAADAVALAYAIAFSYPDNLPDFVRKRAPLFVRDGGGIRCGTALAQQMASAALAGPSIAAIRDHAQEVAGRHGRPDLGGVLGDDMARDRLDMLKVGAYLAGLVQVLPDIVNGDASRYQRSAVYRDAHFVWDLVESNSAALPPGWVALMRDMSLEMNTWYVRNLAMAVR